MTMTTTAPPPTRTSPPLLGRADDDTLFARWQEHRDGAAREELVRRHMPLARSLTRRYRHSSEPFEDLLQVANVALVKAIDRYDTSRPTGFVAFAVPTILGELKRYFRDVAWSVRVPRGLQERVLEVGNAERHLSSELGRSPTVKELARYTEHDPEAIVEALQAGSAFTAVSLDAGPTAGEPEAESFVHTHGARDPRLECAAEVVSITGAMQSLPARDREIVRLRFVEDLTQQEIARRFGISQMQISRILRGTLDKLRRQLGEPVLSS
jgi:RNA polymerase sigma-B factor